MTKKSGTGVSVVWQLDFGDGENPVRSFVTYYPEANRWQIDADDKLHVFIRDEATNEGKDVAAFMSGIWCTVELGKTEFPE